MPGLIAAYAEGRPCDDPRREILEERLWALTVPQLQRIVDWPHEMVLDDCNYSDGKFCPLAVAFDLPRKLTDPRQLTNRNVRKHVKSEGKKQMPGFKINPTKGVKGEFYTTNRLEDLMTLVREILDEKKGTE